MPCSGAGSAAAYFRSVLLLAAHAAAPLGVSAHMAFQEYVPNALHLPKGAAVGHRSTKGGGALNAFGEAFKAAGFEWTSELCHADSDKDGQSNGRELGDPCCVWKPGDVPLRMYGISHPGDHRSVSPIPMPNCSQLDAAIADLANTNVSAWGASGNSFYQFYYAEDLGQEFKPERVRRNEQWALSLGAAGDRCTRRAANGPCAACGVCCSHTPEAVVPQEECEMCEREAQCKCPKPSGRYKATCSGCRVDSGCVLRCNCSANGILHATACNLELCDVLTNKGGFLVCDKKEFMNWGDMCMGTDGWQGLHDRGVRQDEAKLAEGRLSWVHRGGSPAKGLLASSASPCAVTFFCALLVIDRNAFFGRDRYSLTRHLRLGLLATIFVDLVSATMHITLDNPRIMHWPLIGPECRAFQGHHVKPSDIFLGSWVGHLSEAHIINVFITSTVFLNPSCQSLRVFQVYANIASEFMMAAHRWAHTHPAKVPWIVLRLQDSGLLISHQHHSQHHVSYDNNFGLLNGWCNPLLNLSFKLLHHQNPTWCFIWIFVCVVPAIFSWRCVHGPLLSSVPRWLAPLICHDCRREGAKPLRTGKSPDAMLQLTNLGAKEV